MKDQFDERGYVGPVPVLSAEECRELLLSVRSDARPPLDWDKARAVTSRPIYDLATHPAILDVVTAVIGEDVVLWGASLQVRRPGARHAWHSDVESSNPDGRTVSVWLGLEHTSRDSSLQIIPYSHHLGMTVQEARHRGQGGGKVSTGELVSWARERDERSELLKPEMGDGDALLFDGRLWHGSHNLSSGTRRALLLQYATPDTPIRMPDPNSFDWPFRLLEVPRPACLLVRGSDKAGVNRIVPAPLPHGASSAPQLTSWIHPLELPLQEDEKKGWKPYSIFRGSTADLRSLSCHASILSSKRCPHPPHAHEEEEILLLLAGEVDLVLPDRPGPDGDPRLRLRPGEFVYYPAQFTHTLETASDGPSTYLMFKWRSDPAGADSPLEFGQFRLIEPGGWRVKSGFRPRGVFEGPTAYLRKLSCHVSTLTAGAGYEPHLDAHDVAIVVVEGEVETLGQRVGPCGVIFHPAGEPHGIRNPGEAVARYLVLEFHGGRVGS